MQPLVDADVLVYEIGFASETAWKFLHPELDVKEFPPPFDMAAEMLDMRISNICAVVEATMPPILFLTGKTNFRYAIAKRVAYKSGRGNKPYHYKNLLAYIKGKYDYRCVEGLEADDLMAIEQTAREILFRNHPFVVVPSIICTRDKDLRSVPGEHYGWELANQPQFGPERVSYLGSIALSSCRKKVRGSGLLFFYSQCLTGDSVDSIPGINKLGAVKAIKILDGAQTEEEAFKRVFEAYKVAFGDRAGEELLEQGRLLNMSRVFIDNKVLLWNLPGSLRKDWMDVTTGKIETAFEISA